MSDDSTLDRRTLLRTLGGGAALALGGVGTASARPGRTSLERPSPERTRPERTRPAPAVPARRFRADADGRPEVQDAAVVLHDGGSVSGHLRLDGNALARRRRSRGWGRSGDGAPTRRAYSLGLEGAASPAEHARAVAAGRPAAPGLEAGLDVEEPEESGEDGSFGTLTHADGIGAEPPLLGRDLGVWGQTQSQECGPLARTAVLADYGLRGYRDPTDYREHADGSACAGHEWSATFEAFCTYLGWFPTYDCGVPSAFDTTWNVDAAAASGTVARSVFSCSNFPAIQDTVVTAHEVRLTGGGSYPDVEFSWVVGVVDEFDTSDYDLDWNGIANLFVDGLSAIYDVDSVYSYGLAVYLLDHTDGIAF